MTNYVSSMNFLYQSNKVQKELLNWWRPQIGDLATGRYSPVVCVQSEIDIKALEIYKGTEYAIQLLQTHQLIQIIEDKTQCKLGMAHYNKNDILFRLYRDGKVIKSSMCCNAYLLKALWGMTIKILEEE